VHVHRSACSALALVAARGGLEINGIKAGHADDIVVLHYDGDVVRAPKRGFLDTASSSHHGMQLHIKRSPGTTGHGGLAGS
jgi:hypothetical protein